MKKSLILAAGLVALIATAEAGSSTRSRTVTGPQGNTASRTVTASAGGGAVARTATTTGVYGNTATRTRVVAAPCGAPVVRTAVVVPAPVVVARPCAPAVSGAVYRGPHVTAGRVTGPAGNTRGFVRVR